MFGRKVLDRSLVAFAGVCAIPALAAAVPEPTPGLKALFTFDIGTPETDGPSNFAYGPVVNRFVERPSVIFVGAPPIWDRGHGDFVDFDGVSHPGGNAYGFSSAASGRQMIVQFHPSDPAGYEISFDYKSTSFDNAQVATRYAGDVAFTPVDDQPFVADGAWHRVTRDLLSFQDRTLDLGFTVDPTTASGTIVFDNFEIIALPEPGAAALALLAWTILLPRRRRERLKGK